MCRSTVAGGRRCTGGKCAESRRARQRAYTARVRRWRIEEREALAEIDDERTRDLIAEAAKHLVLTPDERQHLRAKRIARIKRQATRPKRSTAPDPDTLTDPDQPAPDAETIRQALLSDPENAADLARRLARRDDLSPEARSVVAAATAADDAGGSEAVPFLDRVLDSVETRSPEAAASRGRAIGEAAREFGMARDAEARVDAAAREHNTDTGGESPAAGLRGDPGDAAGGGGRPGGRLGGVGSSGPAGGADSPAAGLPGDAPSTPVADALAGVPGVGVNASPEQQHAAAEGMVRAVQAARSAGKPFIPSPGDVAMILRRLLGIGSRLSPKLVLLMAARAVSGLITGDDSVSQMTGSDGTGMVWLSMDQGDIGDVERSLTDPRSERFTVGPVGGE